MKSSQRGGFAIGLIVGLLIGLALALGVALYITKAPNPFINKVPTRPAGLDAAEAERNRNWDPNGALAGKNPARPAAVASGVVATPASDAAVPPLAPTARAAPASAPADTGYTAVVVGERPAASAVTASTARATAPPLSGTAGPDPFTYFIQAGAYSRSEDAEQQRAKLAMLGVETRLSEREQAGRTVFRVRAGPFGQREEADAAKERLSQAGIEAALVRVQK